MGSDTAGVIHIIEGTAAARLRSLGDAVLAGQASLVPELEGEADDICAHVGFAGAGLVAASENRRDGRGVNPSGHGNGDGVGVRHGEKSVLVLLSHHWACEASEVRP